jgi:hypothetical protein
MIKIYSKQGHLLNVIYSFMDFKEGRDDITDPREFLQCGIFLALKGKVFKPHKHLNKMVSFHIQEAFILMQGKAKVRIFDLEDNPVGDYPLRAGDLTILLRGGHSLEIEEDAIIYELKNGPYEGQSKDKIWIE